MLRLGKFLFVTAALLLGVSSARDVPANVRSFYNGIVAQGHCANPLASGFFSSDTGPGTFSYCYDHPHLIYLQGRHGALANMDVDCDGIQGGPADDGRCGKSTDTQSITAFQWIVEGYGTGQKDLDANVHPYVVFGNEGGKKKGFATFDPREYGIRPLSVMAVVCGDKLIYGIWGDTNGADGPHPMVGEASISLATACYGKSINGNNGHDPNDVLYIAFPGKEAVPGRTGAKWNAKSYAEFEKSIEGLGNKLIKRIGAHSYGERACAVPLMGETEE